MKMSSRVHDADLVYCGFWFVLIGLPIAMVIYLLHLIERNTHQAILTIANSVK
jgi:hypothetical protein